MARLVDPSKLRGLPAGVRVPSAPPDVPAVRPSIRDIRANARACAHFEDYPPAERPGCGCKHRCTAGMSPQRDMVPPGDGVSPVNCWDCPIAPRKQGRAII